MGDETIDLHMKEHNKPKRIRKKYDHKLTPEEIKEVKKESWKKWYYERGGKEKEKERRKINQRKKAEMYKFYKQQYEENQKLQRKSK